MRQKSKLDDMAQSKGKKPMPSHKKKGGMRSTYADASDDDSEPKYKKPGKGKVKGKSKSMVKGC